jgi:D-cysteine desulfhydrase
MSAIPLFQAHPELETKIPREPIVPEPTPVIKLGWLPGSVWVKRDDLSCQLYGGNKARKFEFIIPDILERKARRMVTIGRAGSNHAVMTSVMAKHYGLGCTLYLGPQEPNDFVRRNLLYMQANGAKIKSYPSIIKAGWAFNLCRKFNMRKYIVAGGGSSPLGTLGFVNAFYELLDQIDQGLLPKPDVVFCPFGSNGTYAGLLVGKALSASDIEVVAVRVSDKMMGRWPISTVEMLMDNARQTLALLSKFSPALSSVTLPKPIVWEEYLGEGYGVETPKSLAARQSMLENEGLVLDPTYTAKTFAAVLDHARASTNKKILFWHTYNSRDFSKVIEGIDYRRLPSALHSYFNREG